MKIAVTYENEQVFQHFGHTEKFKIYEIENDSIVGMSIVNTDGKGHGALATFLKENGVWVFGADMDGTDYEKIDFNCPAAIVIGNEGKGIGELTAKKCDQIVMLPMNGKINSLNASVAAGILMYEVVRKRRSHN